ncbi:mitochondrial ribosomal protein L40 isoform X2 [Megalopta genalis]|uniref:mitochondrial ribosomal protein L40 isoform X2 n=1 Tax=Megalopta genalis TaxID=115081 RepID=UPI0014432ACC|nr:39S ribosomal protein L40, mitochondrial isoform X1 [Megalopta genalis]XP_033328074.1 39S ribosomal protein L40, mitochondrial isoform X2 [Megalopta genalis]
MISVLPVVNAFSRLSMRSLSIVDPRNISTCTYPLYFQVTDVLSGLPIKKKRKLDPAIIRAREERKKRKLEKQIRRLEKHAKQLKPIFEVESSIELAKQKEERYRTPTTLSPEELEKRSLLEKEWTRYKQDQWLKDTYAIQSMMVSQERALIELRIVSEYLYEKAIEFDESFLPYRACGPVNTPSIRNYESPDGVYADTTMKYEGEPESNRIGDK